MRFTGKVAIVTGASQGIGRAIALGLAGEGAAVALVARNEGMLESVAREIEASGGRPMVSKVDVTRSKEVSACVQAVLQKYGKVDILVNNAGWSKLGPFTENTEEFWDLIIATNLKSTIVFSRAVLDDMIKRQYGKIVNISSTAALRGAPGHAVYAAAKGGVISFTRALASEVAKYHINVNCVCPGSTDTPLFRLQEQESPEQTKKITAAVPLGRLGRPEEIASVVLFLASDEAEWMVGQTLSASGGMVMI